MKLADTLRLQNLNAHAAGTQSTTADSRASDAWIKKYLSDKQQRLNDLRMLLHRKLDFNQKGYVETGASDKENEAAERGIRGSWQVYKDTQNQHPERMAGGGKWAVVDRDGLILSVWETKEEAEEASFPIYHGIAPSGTGPTAGTKVKKLEGGGPGSGCQGSNCGRPKSSGLITGPGWYKDGEFYPLENYGGRNEEEHFTAARRLGFATKESWSVKEVLEKNPDLVRIAIYNHGIRAELETLTKQNLRDVVLSLPSDVRTVVVEWWKPKVYSEILSRPEAEELYAEDVFSNPDLGDQTRAKFLKHPKPKVVRVADWLRVGDHRPSSHGGAAGTGGAAGPSGGGGGTS